MAKVSARVPFLNLWSDPLSLTVDSLSLEITVTHHHKTAKSTFFDNQHLDLASSVTSAAGDFVHDELNAQEGAELDRSIRESLILNQSDPFSNSDVPPGAFPSFGDSGSPAAVESTTVLASLVERVLARLECKVNNVRLRLRFEDGTCGGVLELRLGGIRYADETPELSSPKKTIRAITLSSVGVYVLPLSAEFGSSTDGGMGASFVSTSRRTSSTMSSSSSFSSDSHSSEPEDEFHSMVMSQAVADLRESVINPRSSGSTHLPRDLRLSTMSNVSGKSIYHSFVEDETPEPEPVTAVPDREQLADSLAGLDDPFGQPNQIPSAEHTPSPHSPHTSRSQTPTAVPLEPEETLLLSFGTEDIVMRMETSQATPTKRPWAQHDPESPASMPLVIETPPLPVPTVEISVTCGTITALLRPQHTALLLAIAQSATGRPSSSSQAPPPSHATPPQPFLPEFTARLDIKGVFVTMVYDLNPLSHEFEAGVQQYFARPATVYPPAGHLRLKLESISASYALASPKRVQPRRRAPPAKPSSVDVTISDISLFEYLASAESDDDEPPGGTFPVVIFDPNLLKQYEVPPGAPSSLLSTQPRTPANLPEFPEFASVDWRNAGVQKKGGERVWRVKPKAKGILRGHTASTPEQPGAVVTVSQKLGTGDRKWRRVTLTNSCAG